MMQETSDSTARLTDSVCRGKLDLASRAPYFPHPGNAILGLVLGAFLLAPLSAYSQPKFYPDDPLLVDEDQLDTPVEPVEIELSDMYDRFGHIFHKFGTEADEALNANTLDEVGDSSWFTNRHGRARMSVEALVQGPERGARPQPDQIWTVFRSKSQGLTPGFQIFDEDGVRYVIKLDPVGIPELSSAAEAVATKLFYAMGYNVPENYIARFDPDNFAIQEGTLTEDSWGDKVSLSMRRLRRLIRRVPRDEDGKVRVTASKYLPGIPIGPFRYYETRTDDPNDVIPHEHRRELRGLRLIAAWLNHDDTRAQNTQDVYVEENGKHYVRHYLIDFGSTFGSGSIDLQLPNLSFHYWMDVDEMKKNALGFGFHVPKYRRVRWPKFPEYESVGRWEGEAFDPDEWRNDYPNPAFVRMTPRDAFWASKLIMSFTFQELSAIVDLAEFSDPEQAEYFLTVLAQRQTKAGELGIRRVNPLDHFELSFTELRFDNLGEDMGFAERASRYRYQWFEFDNQSSERTSIGEAAATTERALPLPQRGRPDYLCVEISSSHHAYPHWELPVRVYLRSRAGSYHVVGIDREGATDYPPME